MGFLDKLMFWKKNDDLGDLDMNAGMGKNFGSDFGSDFGAGNPTPGGLDNNYGMPQQPQMQDFPQQQQSSFNQPQFQQKPLYQEPQRDYPQQSSGSGNMEVISSKLDALRAMMDSINQRLANIEAMARNSNEEDSNRKRYYRY